MRRIASLVLLTIIAAFAFVFSQPFNAGAATTPLASDQFTRVLMGTWGSADVGGPYTLTGNSANFAVNGYAGLISAPLDTAQLAQLLSVSALNFDATFQVKTNKAAVGGSQMAYFVARSRSNNDYLARVRFAPDNTVQLVAFSQVGGVDTMLGTEVWAPNVQHTAGAYISVHVQVSGTWPTSIRIRVWPSGTPEPSTWAYTVADSNASLQAAGGVGLRSYLDRTSTNAPVVFSFDQLLVTNSLPGTPTPTPSSTPRPTATPTPSLLKHLYWGAIVDGLDPSTQNMQPGGPFDTFEQDAKKKLAVISWGEPWMMNGSLQPFGTSWFDNVRNHGSIPLLTWGSWNLGMGPNQPDFQNAKITGGKYDAFITQWATAAKAWGHPFFLRLDWEMNGWWYPWGEGQTSPGGPIVNGNNPGDFVKMWRHVHDLFVQAGATNVTWIWCINHEGVGTQYPPLSQIYPGGNYVDWTCVDAYNKYYPPSWLGMNSLLTGSGTNWLQNTYQLILNVAPTKPMLIGETASLEYGDGGAQKAAWFSDALGTQLLYNFPSIKALVYYNWNEGNPSLTYPIESTALSQAGFAAGIGLPNYTANQYSNLNTSPIPPP